MVIVEKQKAHVWASEDSWTYILRGGWELEYWRNPQPRFRHATFFASSFYCAPISFKWNGMAFEFVNFTMEQSWYSTSWMKQVGIEPLIVSYINVISLVVLISMRKCSTPLIDRTIYSLLWNVRHKGKGQLCM